MLGRAHALQVARGVLVLYHRQRSGLDGHLGGGRQPVFQPAAPVHAPRHHPIRQALEQRPEDAPRHAESDRDGEHPRLEIDDAERIQARHHERGQGAQAATDRAATRCPQDAR